MIVAVRLLEDDTDHNPRFFGFALLGSLIQAPISNRWGRKMATAVAATLLAIGGAIQAGSQNVPMFLCARYIAGTGCGMVISNTPGTPYLTLFFHK